MKRLRKVLVSFMMLCMLMCNCVTAFASATSADSLDALCNAAKSDKNISVGWDYSAKTYKCSDGSYLLYSELVNTGKSTDLINDTQLKLLTTGSKSDFLTDYYNAAQYFTDYSEKNTSINGVNTGTMTNWMELLQNESGVGSQLMTTLMSQTKPDFVTANRIYEPFSGTVGTILGIVSILIMAFLAITMVLDLAYIAIPTFQLFIDGDGQGGQGGGKKKSFISHEAMDAVQQAEGGQGGGGQSGGSNKLAVSIYFKKRVVMLVVLGICLLYLISGNIFAFVGWFIDLLSGFLGF